MLPDMGSNWHGVRQYISLGNQPLNPVVAHYREFSSVVDGANQMALQLRLMMRQTTGAGPVRVFMLRYVAANAFTAC